MRKVIFFTGNQALSGGTEKACANVVNALADSKSFKIDLVSNFLTNKKLFFSVNRSVQQHRFFNSYKCSKLKNLLLFFLYPYLVFKKKPDVVVAVESINFLFFFLIIIFRPSCRLVCWEHFNAASDLGVRRRRWARWLAARFAHKIVVLSNEDIRYWRSIYKPPTNKLCVIYNIVLPGSEAVRQRAVANGGTRIVLTAGRLEHQKGFDLLLKAWSLIDKSIRRSWELRIAGDGSLSRDLKEMALTLGIDESVKFIGLVHDMDREYEKARFFVLSSRFEGFGLVLVEALSKGLPCVSFKCPAGPADIIVDGVNGLLVPETNVEALRKALLLLLTDPCQIDQLALHSNVGLERFFTASVKSRWEDLIENV